VAASATLLADSWFGEPCTEPVRCRVYWRAELRQESYDTDGPRSAVQLRP
jgi:hypothetical protein